MKGNARKVYAFLSTLLIASVIVSIIIFIAGWLIIFKVSTDMGKVKTERNYLNKELIALETLKKNYKTVSDSENLVFDSLPKDKTVSSFMADMETLASKNNLKITESLIGFGKDSSKLKDPSLSQMVKVSNYYQLNVKFSIEGSYTSFMNFVSEANSLRRVNSISSISLFRTSEAMMKKTDTVKATFVSSIYVKK
jgi:Tfp pilus assembly protein PilO